MRLALQQLPQARCAALGNGVRNREAAPQTFDIRGAIGPLDAVEPAARGIRNQGIDVGHWVLWVSRSIRLTYANALQQIP